MSKNAIQNAVRLTKTDRAKRMSLDDRLATGARFYAEQCEIVRDFVADLHSDRNPDQVRDQMNRRQKLSRDLDSRRFYRISEAENRLPEDLS